MAIHPCLEWVPVERKIVLNIILKGSYVWKGLEKKTFDKLCYNSLLFHENLC